jgi:hypothetical protein
MRRVAFLVVALQVAGCGRTQGTAAEQQLVDHFHAELNQGQYAQIYSERDKLLSTPEAQYMRLLTTVHRKLGDVRSDKLDSVTTAVNSKGTFIILRYTTQFQHGTAREAFNWHLDGDSAKLAGYFIERDASAKN